MRAVVYSHTGGREVLRLVERPAREPGPGEVRVKMQVSGVNPTDWKARRRSRAGAELPFPELVPNQDGAGTIDAAGDGVPTGRVGERVWLWEAAWQRADGTAQELVVIPSRQAVRLPDAASMDVGASLGIPALTAHRCLTVSELGPRKLAPRALHAQTVLVAGGAGAVGHAAIQLACWAGARVISTVSSDEKAELALSAGAEHAVNYRASEAADEIRALAPKGIDVIVEVAPAENAVLDGTGMWNNIAYWVWQFTTAGTRTQDRTRTGHRTRTRTHMLLYRVHAHASRAQTHPPRNAGTTLTVGVAKDDPTHLMMYGRATSLFSVRVFADYWNTSQPDSSIFTPPRACLKA